MNARPQRYFACASLWVVVEWPYQGRYAVNEGPVQPKLQQSWNQMKGWQEIFSQLNSIVLFIAKSQYFQLILYEMIILLGNGIIQQPILYYEHCIYALLSQKVLCPQSKIPFLQPLVVDVRKVNQVGQVGFVWFGLVLIKHCQGGASAQSEKFRWKKRHIVFWNEGRGGACRICGSLAAGLPGTFLLPGTFYELM